MERGKDGKYKYNRKGGTERRFRSKRDMKEFCIEKRLLKIKIINGGRGAYTSNERKREKEK